MSTPEQSLLELLQENKPTAESEGGAVEEEMEKDSPDSRTPVSLKNLFTHHDTHPMVLDLTLRKQFGIDWYEWEPETVWAEIRRSFKTEISELNRAKVQTIKSLRVSELPWKSWQVFEKIVQGLNNNIPRFDVMQAPRLEQLFVALDVMEGIRQNPGEFFTDEVKLYMAAAVLHEDVFYVPRPLDFIQAEVSQPYWYCKDCGSIDSALFHDGICDTCTRKFDPERGLSMTPDPDLLKAGKGRNLELRIRFNPDETEALWKKYEHQALKDVDPPETAAGVQVSKLLVARDYMNVRRRQLVDQLTSLRSWLEAP